MTMEVILWLVAWVVLSEVVFVISYFKYGENSIYSWGFFKYMSFICVGGFIAIQAVIVFVDKTANFGSKNYIHLLYELIVIVVIAGLFFCNWLISKKIDKSKEKKERANKSLLRKK